MPVVLVPGILCFGKWLDYLDLLVEISVGWLTRRCVLGLIAGLRARPDGQVAQSVEQGTENPRVGSSILSLATI